MTPLLPLMDSPLLAFLLATAWTFVYVRWFVPTMDRWAGMDNHTRIEA